MPKEFDLSNVSDDFWDDLRSLLSSDKQDICVLNTILESNVESVEQVRSISREKGINPSKTLDSLRAILYLSKMMKTEEYNERDLHSALVSYAHNFHVDEEYIPKIIDLIERSKNRVRSNENSIERKYMLSTIPLLHAVSPVTDLRVIYDSDGEAIDIKPVVIIRLATIDALSDDETENSILFQTDEDGFDKLISILISERERMQKVKSKIALEDSAGNKNG